MGQLREAQLGCRDSQGDGFRALRKEWHLSAYRTDAGAEVDLVVEGDGFLLALDVKAGRNVSTTDTRGLRSFAEVAGRGTPVRRWIVYRGERRQRFDDGTEVWPVEDALRELAGGPV